MTDSPTRQDWFFTFGFDHRLNGSPLSRRFVRIHGTEGEARQKMVEHFGTGWAFMYSTAEEAGVQRHDLTELRLEAAANACPICRGTGKEPIVDDVGEPGFRWCECTASVPKDAGTPEPKDERTVHQLDAGRALCGKRGFPGEWGPGHVWVSIQQGPVSAVNCPGCLLVRDRPGVVTALVGLARRALAWRSQGRRSKWTTARSQALADEVDLMKERYPTFFEEFAADVQNAGAVVLDGPSGAQPELQIECSCGEVFAPMQCPRCERRYPPIVMAHRPMVWHAESGTYREVEPEEYTDDPPYKRTAAALRKFAAAAKTIGYETAAAVHPDLLDDALEAFEAEDLEQ